MLDYDRGFLLVDDAEVSGVGVGPGELDLGSIDAEDDKAERAVTRPGKFDDAFAEGNKERIEQPPVVPGEAFDKAVVACTGSLACRMHLDGARPRQREPLGETRSGRPVHQQRDEYK